MPHKLNLSWILLGIAAIAGAFLSLKKYTPTAKAPTVILVSFGSYNSSSGWAGEATPYGEQLSDIQDISASIPLCQNAFSGTIFGQPIILAISGMAKVRTSACVSSLLQYSSGRVKEIILSGIGGISTAQASSQYPKIGDLCINSVALDFDRQYYASDMAASSSYQPIYWANSHIYSSSGSNQLASDLYMASQAVIWPDSPAAVKTLNQKYGIPSGIPYVWQPTQCLEASGDQFWHDSTADSRARALAAELLSVREPVIITSMEAVAAGTVIEKWNLANHMAIPFAYVRSASNFSLPAIGPNKLPLENGKDSIVSAMAGENTQYAIRIQALPVLKLLEQRNK